VVLIVSSVVMPRMDGLEFLRVMREREPMIPVIVIASGDNAIDQVYLRGADLLGAARSFTWPLMESAFVDCVRDAGGPGLERDPEKVCSGFPQDRATINNLEHGRASRKHDHALVQTGEPQIDRQIVQRHEQHHQQRRRAIGERAAGAGLRQPRPPPAPARKNAICGWGE